MEVVVHSKDLSAKPGNRHQCQQEKKRNGKAPGVDPVPVSLKQEKSIYIKKADRSGQDSKQLANERTASNDFNTLDAVNEFYFMGLNGVPADHQP